MEFVVSGIITTLSFFYVQSKLINEKINYKSIIFYIVLFFSTATLLFTYDLTQHYIKILLNFTILVISCYILYRKSIVKTFLVTLLTFILLFLAEFLFVIGLSITLNISIEQLDFNLGSTIIPNIIISLILILIVNIRGVFLALKNIINNFTNYENKTFFLTGIYIVFLYSLFFYSFYFNVHMKIFVLLSLFLIIFLTILLLKIFLEKKYNKSLESEYKMLIDNLSEYEKFLEDYRLKNHENNNDLIILREMVINNNEAVKYIDNILNIKPNEDKELLYKTKRIPTGGLQGLFYQKLLTIKTKSIHYHLEVSKKIQPEQFKKLDNFSKQTICKISGILLDNAIEAVENLEQKYISLYIYNENDYFVISISNNFTNCIEIDKIDSKTYSSKGNNRGYGLSLVKNIVSKNRNIKLEREFIGDIFKQKIKLKM